MKDYDRLVLRYIIEFKKTNGYSPTIREIADGLNTKNTTYIQESLSRLQANEYITMKDRQARTIVVKKFI